MENCIDGFGAVGDGHKEPAATTSQSATEYFDHPSAGSEFFLGHFGAETSLRHYPSTIVVTWRGRATQLDGQPRTRELIPSDAVSKRDTSGVHRNGIVRRSKWNEKWS